MMIVRGLARALLDVDFGSVKILAVRVCSRNIPRDLLRRRYFAVFSLTPLMAIVIASSICPVLASEPAKTARVVSLLENAQFHSVSIDTLEQSKLNLTSSLSDVPTNNEVKNEDWENLKTKAVRQALQSNENLTAYLANLIEKLSQNGPPYDNQKLVKLRSLARTHLRLMENYEKRKEIEATFDRGKPRLLDALKIYIQTGSPSHFDCVAWGVRWCEEHDLASDFVLAAKQDLTYPNIEIRIPASVLRIATDQQFDRTEPIERNSDGISTRGIGQFHASGFLEPAASFDGGLMMRVQGKANFSTTSTRKKVHFQSFATTNISGAAAITFDSHALMTNSEPKLSANTYVQNCRSQADILLGKRIVGRIVDRVIAQKTPEVEQSMTKEVTEGLQKELNAQLNEIVGKANALVNDQVWPKARQLDLIPRKLSVKSTIDELRLLAFEDAQSGLAAPQPCPIRGGDAASIAMHESMATSLINLLYMRHPSSEQSLNADLMQAISRQLNGEGLKELKDYLQVDQGSEFTVPDDPLLEELELDYPRPFRVAIRKDQLGLIIRARKIKLFSEKEFSNFELKLTYQLVRSSNGLDAKLELLKDKDDAPFMQLSKYDTNQVDSSDLKQLDEILHKELVNGFPKSITIKSKAISGGDSKISARPSRIALEQGWIAVFVSIAKKL